MRKTFLFLLTLLLTAGAAHGARGQQEMSLAGAFLGAFLEATLDGFCEEEEPDCEENFDSALVLASCGCLLGEAHAAEGAEGLRVGEVEMEFVVAPSVHLFE